MGLLFVRIIHDFLTACRSELNRRIILGVHLGVYRKTEQTNIEHYQSLRPLM